MNLTEKLLHGNVALVVGVAMGVVAAVSLLLGLIPDSHEAAYPLFFYPVTACVALFVLLSGICSYVAGDSPRGLSFKNHPIREALEQGANTPLKKYLVKMYWGLNFVLMMLVGYLGLSPFVGLLLI